MAFFDTFLAVLSATLISQICIWIIQKFVIPHLDHGHERLKKSLSGGDIMGNVLSIDIEKAQNGGFLVSEIIKAKGFMGKGGESNTLVFKTIKEFESWLEARLGG